MLVSAVSCLIGVFFHSVEHDLSSFTEVLYSLYACVNLPQYMYLLWPSSGLSSTAFRYTYTTVKDRNTQIQSYSLQQKEKQD